MTRFSFFSHSGIVLRLPREDIAYFRPARLYIADRAVVLERTYSPQLSNALRNAYPAFESKPCDAGVRRTGCEDQGNVYLVAPAAFRANL